MFVCLTTPKILISKLRIINVLSLFKRVFRNFQHSGPTENCYILTSLGPDLALLRKRDSYKAITDKERHISAYYRNCRN